ncbi:MAG: hypothetical protein GX341_00625 [Firmicutes bacterium]|jgi:hypothetical protein|nr:hypothetical protein [Bacillota bacterium]
MQRCLLADDGVVRRDLITGGLVEIVSQIIYDTAVDLRQSRIQGPAAYRQAGIGFRVAVDEIQDLLNLLASFHRQAG